MEQETVTHDIFHKHPLCRIPNLFEETNEYRYKWCRGCWRYFLSGEAAYGCSVKCGSDVVFHQECLEMPREIRHPLHPSHTLTLQLAQERYCVVCDANWGGMVYKCSGGCEVQIHIGCVGSFEIVAAHNKNEIMQHPSHRQHLLKKTRSCSCSFRCDACGISDAQAANSSYICTVCDYWIHEKCALLPLSKSFPSHHHHSLSLSFNLPYEYIKYEFDCAICSGPLRLRHWVYHCYHCRYVVHINCATKAPPPTIQKKSVDDEKGITKIFPVDDIYGEIIRGFVKREIGEIAAISYDNSGTYEFKNHSHPLRFTTFSNWLPSSSSHDHNEDEDDDDDDDDGIPLRCDGCTLPIHDRVEEEKGYMSCDECKYFLHLSCFNLPPQLPSHPLHPVKDHNLELFRNAGNLTNWAFCHICIKETNGLLYSCTECYFTIDIKCASLPSTIKHAAHPRHNYLDLITGSHEFVLCGLCYNFIHSQNAFYKCDGCRFSVCRECILLPAYNKHRLEKHRMPLTYNAYVNRPGDFYCSSCEGKMNPRKRMYHCQDCDQSFHPQCFPATSGEYRNINFGRQLYVIPTIHDPHHPLRFQIITKKKRCDLCHRDRYNKPGFQCVSCNFVMCFYSCYRRHKDAFQAI